MYYVAGERDGSRKEEPTLKHLRSFTAAMLLVLILVAPTGAEDDGENYDVDVTILPGESVTYYFGPNAPTDGAILGDELVFSTDDIDEAYFNASFMVDGQSDPATFPGASCGPYKWTTEILDPDRNVIGEFKATLDCESVPQVLTIYNDTCVNIKISRIWSRSGGTSLPKPTEVYSGRGDWCVDGPPQQPPEMPDLGGGGTAGRGQAPIIVAPLMLLWVSGRVATARR